MSTAPSDPFQPGLLPHLPEPPRRVAVLKASRLGDLICTTPAFRALRAALPSAEITLITLPILKDLALRLPYIDHYAEFPGFPGLAEQLFEPRQAVRFFEAMQAQNFDLAIQFQGTGVYSNPFLHLLGAQYSAGFIRPSDPPGLLSAALPWPETGHEIDRNLALTGFLGAPPQGETTDYPLWPSDLEAAACLLEGAPRPWVGLHPSARQTTRRWPLEHFVQAAVKLQQRLGGSIVLLGEADQERAAPALREAGLRLLDLSGKTSLPVLGAVISRLSVLLTNDTGPAHIAYALGAPVVTIFGGAHPARYGPHFPGPFKVLAHPVDCRPCSYSDCPIGNLCLESITVDQVLSAAEELIADD